MTEQLSLDGLTVAADPKIQSPKAPKSSESVIFCDGACSGNPGPGGWGCIVEWDGERREFSGGQARTTNNQMELLALIEGLKQVPVGAKVRVVTDSEYVAKGVTSWLKGWIRNGWMTAAKKPVKNQELWQQIQDLTANRPIKMEWVRGHAGHAENERCDELARGEIQKLTRR